MSLSLPAWLALHTVTLAFWWWLLCGDGARRVEGWFAWLLVGWFAGHWNETQIRLYALVLLVVNVAWFLLGLIFPALRFAR